MIRDYFVLISITFVLMIVTLVSSFAYYVLIETIIETFTGGIISDPMYNITHDPFGRVADITEGELEPFRFMFTLIQWMGIISIILSIVASAILVSRVRYSPFGIPIAIVLYIIGIFISMVYSNTYAYIAQTLQSMVAEYTIETYLNWIGYNMPWIMAVAGAVLFIFAYTKAPMREEQNQGFQVI